MVAIPLLISTVILDIENYERNTEPKNRVWQERAFYIYIRQVLTRGEWDT